MDQEIVEHVDKTEIQEKNLKQNFPLYKMDQDKSNFTDSGSISPLATLSTLSSPNISNSSNPSILSSSISTINSPIYAKKPEFQFSRLPPSPSKTSKVLDIDALGQRLNKLIDSRTIPAINERKNTEINPKPQNSLTPISPTPATPASILERNNLYSTTTSEVIVFDENEYDGVSVVESYEEASSILPSETNENDLGAENAIIVVTSALQSIMKNDVPIDERSKRISDVAAVLSKIDSNSGKTVVEALNRISIIQTPPTLPLPSVPESRQISPLSQHNALEDLLAELDDVIKDLGTGTLVRSSSEVLNQQPEPYINYSQNETSIPPTQSVKQLMIQANSLNQKRLSTNVDQNATSNLKRLSASTNSETLPSQNILISRSSTPTQVSLTDTSPRTFLSPVHPNDSISHQGSISTNEDDEFKKESDTFVESISEFDNVEFDEYESLDSREGLSNKALAMMGVSSEEELQRNPFHNAKAMKQLGLGMDSPTSPNNGGNESDQDTTTVNSLTKGSYVYCGYLGVPITTSLFIKNYRNMFCVLVEGQLYYFKTNEPFEQALGVIPISGEKISSNIDAYGRKVVQVKSTVSSKKKGSVKKSWDLHVEDEEEMKTWVRMLQRAIPGTPAFKSPKKSIGKKMDNDDSSSDESSLSQKDTLKKSYGNPPTLQPKSNTQFDDNAIFSLGIASKDPNSSQSDKKFNLFKDPNHSRRPSFDVPIQNIRSPLLERKSMESVRSLTKNSQITNISAFNTDSYGGFKPSQAPPIPTVPSMQRSFTETNRGFGSAFSTSQVDPIRTARWVASSSMNINNAMPTYPGMLPMVQSPPSNSLSPISPLSPNSRMNQGRQSPQVLKQQNMVVSPGSTQSYMSIDYRGSPVTSPYTDMRGNIYNNDILESPNIRKSRSKSESGRSQTQPYLQSYQNLQQLQQPLTQQPQTQSSFASQKQFVNPHFGSQPYPRSSSKAYGTPLDGALAVLDDLQSNISGEGRF
ncbi:hypothetical protein HK096_002606 [Nowakowskiella sp. JEL0078]|nr:hypothetical protein HK096_002606 [Nowakowskiella sp. JEL0078]